MSFVEKTLGPGEHLLGVAAVHWIYGVKGLLWLFVPMTLAMVAENMTMAFFEVRFGGAGYELINIIGNALFWIAAILGATMCLFYFVLMVSTELGLTDRRIILKKGLFFVDVKEIDLDEFKAADIDHGFLGRFLNYGYIRLDSRFISDATLPAIAGPYRFLKALNEMRERLGDDKDIRAMTAPVEKPPKDSEHYSLEDERYDSLSEDSAGALQEVGRELHESVQHISDPARQAAQQRKEEQHAKKKKDKQAQQNDGPVVFEHDPLKEELQEELVHDFEESKD